MKIEQYRALDVECAPAAAEMLPGICYVETDEDAPSPWRVALLCPCGCGNDLYVLIRGAVPNTVPQTWILTRHQGTITLEPSFDVKVGCRSHFYLTQGRISWCQPHGY